LTKIHSERYADRVSTQADRRADTRRRLLDAAAELFAERGIDGASIDAVADAAGRTSGAIYDHFGGKEGLLLALLQSWVDDVAAVVTAELIAATTLEERMAALWRNVKDPPMGGGRWMALEHELWRYAVRHDTARAHLARRYRVAWEGTDAVVRSAYPDGAGEGGGSVGPALVGLLLGLEMMRRVDPAAVTDELAVDALIGIVRRLQTKEGTTP
jgi:AcrR family transcriptional regulator